MPNEYIFLVPSARAETVVPWRTYRHIGTMHQSFRYGRSPVIRSRNWRACLICDVSGKELVDAQGPRM